jgi:hypothetical protein
MTAVVAGRRATDAPATGRGAAVVLALLMPVGPALVAALRGLLPTFTSDGATQMAAAVARSPGRQSAVLWLGYLAVLTLVPGVLAAAALARHGAPRLAAWAVALLVPAYLSMGALLTGDAVLWSGQRAGLSTASTGLLYDHLHPSIDVAVAVFVVGHVVGTVLLGLALLRSRAIRAPFAWALTVSQPLHLVAFVILGVQALDVAAWMLTTVGMAAAAVALVQHSQRPGVVVP